MSVEARIVDPDAEREVDLRSAWSRITARWWLSLAGAILGALLGIAASVSSGDVFVAKSLVYLGQPFTPGGGGQIQSLQTNPKTVSEVIRSEAAIERAANDSGLTKGQLRGKVTSIPITVGVGLTAKNLSPLTEIQVQAPRQEAAEKAADSFARSVLDIVAPYVERKLELLQAQIASDNAQLTRLDARIANAVAQQNQLTSDKALPLAERLVALQSVNSNLTAAEAQRITIQADRTSISQLIALADQVERSKIIQQATAARTQATSRRNAFVVGALAGLLLGALAAVIADPYLRRRAARSAT